MGAHVLLLAPSSQAAAPVAATLSQLGADFRVAEGARAAWLALADRRPDVVLLDLGTPDVTDFFRRLRDEYMGVVPRLVAFADETDIAPAVARLNLDAVIKKPVEPELVQAAVNIHGRQSLTSLNPGRLREMLKVTTLGAELQKAVDELAHRLVLIYGVSNCFVVAQSCERQWVGTVGEPVPVEQWPMLWTELDEVICAGAPVLAVDPSGEIYCRLATPIRTPNDAVIGGVCLVSRGPRLFAVEARDAMLELSTRIGAEMSWRSVHHRVSSERDQLRENAMFDGMLGILSRGALDQFVTTEVARARRSKRALTVAIVDVTGLRDINDMYGHVAGDAALKSLAQIIQRVVRAQDIVGRYGGDEIAVIMGDTTTAEATDVLGRVVRTVAKTPFLVGDGAEITIKVSVGVAAFGGDDEDGASCLARAAATSQTAVEHGSPIAISGSDQAQMATLALRSSEAGSTLAGMYQIVHEISRGAMGVVYRAEDLGLSRPVAIKMLRPDLTRDDDLVRRFREEAGTLAALHHDNLVQVHAFVEDKDDVFFVMELVEGLSLHSLINAMIEEKKFLSADRAGIIISQIASALDEMHAAGVLHRDVKPANIVLDRSRDRAVLVDVGLAKRVGGTGEASGTPGYVAPETFSNEAESRATDVYGLAATVYTMLVNRAPFGHDKNVRTILRRQLASPPANPSELRSDLLSDTDRVLLRALSVRPAERYPTAGAFAAELLATLDSQNENFEMPSVRLGEPLSASQVGAAASSVPPSVMPQLMPSAHTGLGSRLHNVALDLPGNTTNLPKSVGLTRGIVFRAAATTLKFDPTSPPRGLLADHPKLAEALSPRTSPMKWVEAQLFFDLLELGGKYGAHESAGDFAYALGRVAVELSFAQFYPSSVSSLSPQGTLSACDILWRRYHSWGSLAVDALDEAHAEVSVHFVGDTSSCQFVVGWLEEIAHQSQGARPRAEHQHLEDDQRCVFDLRWR